MNDISPHVIIETVFHNGSEGQISTGIFENVFHQHLLDKILLEYGYKYVRLKNVQIFITNL
jgi:hypothetical protein